MIESYSKVSASLVTLFCQSEWPIYTPINERYLLLFVRLLINDDVHFDCCPRFFVEGGDLLRSDEINIAVAFTKTFLDLSTLKL